MAEVARLGGGILGGTIGFFIGGPVGASIGFSLGSIAGGLVAGAITGPQQFVNESPLPPDLTFSGSTQGTVIKRVYGNARVAGNIIQYRDRLEKVTTTTRQGGKGLGGASSVTTNISYRRMVDCVYAVCAGETDLYEIFVDGDRLYSQATGANGSTLGNWRWYRGSESQLTDSQSQAIFGDNQPAYRGTAYWVTNDWDLSQYNNRLPNLTFAVTNNVTYQKTNVEIPEVSVIPEGYTRPLGFSDAYANIRNKRDGSGYYYILKKDGAYHLAEYSHASRSVVSISAPWNLYNPVGNRVINAIGTTSEVLTGNFAWGDEDALSFYNFEVDDEYVYIIAELQNATFTNFGPDNNYFLLAIRRSTGTSFPARNPEENILIRGIMLSVGTPIGGEYPVQAAPPIQGVRLLWCANRVSQRSIRGRDATTPTVMAIALDKGRFNSGEPLFEVVYHWRASQTTDASPISFLSRDVCGVMDPEFDESNLSYSYYRVLLGSDRASAALIKYTVTFPFFPIYVPPVPYLDSFINSTRAEISGRTISGMFPFSWNDNQYNNRVAYDAATKNIIFHAGLHDTQNVSSRVVIAAIDTISASVISTVTKGELAALDGYAVMGPNLLAMNFTDPIYDPNGYFWLYRSIGTEPAVRINTNDVKDTTYFQPNDYTPGGLILEGRVSYDYLGNGIQMWNEGGTDRILLLGRGTADKPSLSGILEDLLKKAGLDASDYDISDLAGFPANVSPADVEGYVISKPSTVWEAISQLATAYGFYMIESEAKLKFKSKYGRTPTQIRTGDLGASEDGALNIYEERSAQLSQLPNTITLNYIDKEFDYQQGTQIAKRATRPNNNNPVIDSPLTLTAKSARYIVDRLLFEEWQNRRVATFALPLRGEEGAVYLGLEPGDVVAFNYEDTFNKQEAELYEILEVKSRGLQLEFIVRGFEDAYYNTLTTLDYIGDVGLDITPTPAPIQYPPEWRLIDMVALREEDSDIGYYHASGSNNQLATFLGLTLYKRTGEDFDVVDLVDVGADMGVSLTVLPRYAHMNWDLANTLDIQLNTSRTLTSFSEESVLEGSGSVIIGTPQTGWELIQYQDVTDLGAGKWRLSKLLRNRRGSEDTAPETQHEAYSQIILVPTQNSGVRRTGIGASLINTELEFKPAGVGFSLAATPSKIYTYTAASSQCRSPSDLTATRSGGNIVISWKRRDRLVEGWEDLIDLPNSETTETYLVTIGDTGFTVNTASLTTADVFPSPVNITVQQISSQTGAGFANTISI